MDEQLSEHEKTARSEPRDEHGQFIHTELSPEATQTPQEHTNPFSQFLHNETAVHKTHDDSTLLDVHVGNPLRRITQLLEDIKRQKAFSFTLKGSLGIMGVVLVAGTFGILGGSKALCDKGTQTKIGEVRELNFKENSEKTFLNYIPFLESYLPERRIPRKIMLDNGGKVIHLVGKNDVDFMLVQPEQKMLTGNYDSCSETLTVNDQTGIEQFFR